jgi:hypothetical protein
MKNHSRRLLKHLNCAFLVTIAQSEFADCDGMNFVRPRLKRGPKRDLIRPTGYCFRGSACLEPWAEPSNWTSRLHDHLHCTSIIKTAALGPNLLGPQRTRSAPGPMDLVRHHHGVKSHSLGKTCVLHGCCIRHVMIRSTGSVGHLGTPRAVRVRHDSQPQNVTPKYGDRRKLGRCLTTASTL